MSFLRLRHPPLDPDESNFSSDTKSVLSHSQQKQPSSPPPSSTTTYSNSIQAMILPRMINRSVSASDPPGTYDLINRSSATTHNTTKVKEEDDDTSSWSSTNHPEIKNVSSSEDDDRHLHHRNVSNSNERRNDPPVLHRFATHPLDCTRTSSSTSEAASAASAASKWSLPLLSQSSVATTVTSTSSLLEGDSVHETTNHNHQLLQQERDDMSTTTTTSSTKLLQLEHIPESRSHIKFNKDANLVSSSSSKLLSPLTAYTRSPEVTQIDDTVMTNDVKTAALEMKEDPSEQFQFNTTFSSRTQYTDNAGTESTSSSPFSIHKSVRFSVVQVYENIIFDTSVESLDGASSYKPSSSDNNTISPDETSIPKSLDPPESSVVLVDRTSPATISTVDEYEAQRQPKRRHFKDVEGKKEAPNSTMKNYNRSDQLRRILSNHSIIPSSKSTSLIRFHGSTPTGSYNNGGFDNSTNSKSSEYVSVQELVPPKTQHWNLGFGNKRQQQEPEPSTNNNSMQHKTTTSTQQPPQQVGSEQPDDIFEAYQQSFIGGDDDDQSQQSNQPRPSSFSINNGNARQLPRPSLFSSSSQRSRSLSSLSVSRNSFSSSQTRSKTTSHDQEQQQRRGVLGRLFSGHPPKKKDANLRVEL